MSDMRIFTKDGHLVTDSRMVAEMVDKQHKNLLMDIRNYIEIMQSSIELKIQPNEFFIESEYKDSIGRTLPCYLCTKKGCEMIANKLTGEKGILFTATYVSRFEEMEKQIQFQRLEHPRSDVGEIASLMKAWLSMMTKAKIPYQHGISEMIKFMQSIGIPITDGILQLEQNKPMQLSVDFKNGRIIGNE